MGEFNENKPYGGYGNYEDFVKEMSEDTDICLYYKEKEYWFQPSLVGTRKNWRPAISVYYADWGTKDIELYSKQASETRQDFEGRDIRVIIDQLIMHDGRPFKEVIKEPNSIEWG